MLPLLKNVRRRHSAHVGLLLVLGVVACGGSDATTLPHPTPSPTPVPVGDTTPLRVAASGAGLLVGSAVDRGFRYSGADGVQFRSVLAREFNILTPENDMKWSRIHPQQAAYYFAGADSLVDFARANGMQVRGHTLVWHQQLPSWLTSGTWTSDQAAALLSDHIATVVGHYRGRVREWDVVNEALNDDGALRSTFWLDHIGRGYIEQAFRAARQADSSALLFYNDYGIEWPGAKQDSAYALVSGLLAKGVRVDGVGLQSHFQVGSGTPSQSALAATIARFAALGLKVHLTELDIRMRVPASDADLATQAANYHDVFAACRQNPACDVIVMWGFTDRESWVPGTFAGWGAALLMDSTYQKKPAYTAVQGLLEGK